MALLQVTLLMVMNSLKQRAIGVLVYQLKVYGINSDKVVIIDGLCDGRLVGGTSQVGTTVIIWLTLKLVESEGRKDLTNYPKPRHFRWKEGSPRLSLISGVHGSVRQGWAVD